MSIGTIKRFFDDRGFGFITPDDGDPDVFVGDKALPAGYEPKPGDRVSFEVETDRQGRARAANVQPV